MVPREYVTTAFDLPGFRVKRNLGVVRGIVVRSRSIVGTLGASLQTIAMRGQQMVITFVVVWDSRRSPPIPWGCSS